MKYKRSSNKSMLAQTSIITFITGNRSKFEETEEIFKNTGVTLFQKQLNTPEIQSEGSKQIAEFFANYISKTFNKPFFVMDRSFHIKALNGFPGPYVKQINEWLTSEDILELLEQTDNREAFWTTSICCYLPEKGINIFTGNQMGYISKVSGENTKWVVDSIFIPEGYDKVLSSFSSERRSEFWNSSSVWEELISYLKVNL